MEVICPRCETKLNIPDEKIPENQTVKVNCPRCKNKITIRPDGPVEEGQRDEAVDKGLSDYEDYIGDEALDFFDEDTKPALIMAGEEILEKIRTSVEELGYRFVSASNIREAMGKMRFHHFDLVLLADGFDSQGIDNSPVLSYLNHISMSIRRRIFFGIIGENFKTMDEMKAYTLSANIVINSKDLDKLTPILKKGLSEHERFYKVFMDTLAEVGKA